MIPIISPLYLFSSPSHIPANDYSRSILGGRYCFFLVPSEEEALNALRNAYNQLYEKEPKLKFEGGGLGKILRKIDVDDKFEREIGSITLRAFKKESLLMIEVYGQNTSANSENVMLVKYLLEQKELPDKRKII